MYSHADRIRAVRLYIKLGKRVKATIRQLGYDQTRHFLRQRHKVQGRGTGNGASPPRPSSTLQIKGKKRHILSDAVGLLLHALVHPADIQDRHGGVLVLKTLFGRYLF